MTSPEPEAVFSFKKKKAGRGRPAGVRKRSLSPSTQPAQADDPEPSAVVQATRKQAANHLIQGTGGFKRRKQDQDDTALASSDEDAPKDAFGVNHSSKTVRLRRRSSSPPAEVSGTVPVGRVEAGEDDGLYRGAAKQQHNLNKSFGPIKGGPSNVRTITLVDYQPDTCKDYKGKYLLPPPLSLAWLGLLTPLVLTASILRDPPETGFCGFGDTCKFLHDRGDYLHGWQLDNSFLSSQAAAGSFMAKQRARDGDDDGPAGGSDSENEDLPFACLICRKAFSKDPVVTLCGHYFDSACAIKRFAKNTKCFACGKGTQGVFNK